MSIIHLLPDHIANQIAAGEVVQRPASVVKELMENAVDAGAQNIKVIIKDAGRTSIQIIDDGKGMLPTDAIKCFERHATSKITVADDLFSLKTKGFRGEALASISAVAHVVLKTRQEEVELGFSVEIEGSKISKQEETVCAKGTSFEIRNLFYNIPARRNFLKSDYVEFGHLQEEFIRVALAHPECKFILIHNDQELLHLNSGVLRKRIVDILGKSSNEHIVPIEEATDIIKIEGYVGKPEFARKSRGEQYLFVNNRFFKDAYFNHAVTKAFEGLVPEKSFPSYFIFLTVDPSKIDVNIHPTKTEIKFEEDRFIYSILLSSIKKALGKYNIMPTLDFEIETSFDIPSSFRKNPLVEPQIIVNPNYNPFHKQANTSSKSDYSKGIQGQGFGTDQPDDKDWENFYAINKEDAPARQGQIELDESFDTGNNFLIRGKYILSNCKSGVMVIDIKRATERIRYEQLLLAFVKEPIQHQALLFPIEKELSKDEIRIWTEHESLLGQLGFTGVLKENTLHLGSTPNALHESQIETCFSALINLLVHSAIDKGDLAHQVVAVLAYNSARTATIQVPEQASRLIEELFSLPEHAFCPSGKPIIKTITLEEIAAKF